MKYAYSIILVPFWDSYRKLFEVPNHAVGILTSMSYLARNGQNYYNMHKTGIPLVNHSI